MIVEIQLLNLQFDAIVSADAMAGAAECKGAKTLCALVAPSIGSRSDGLGRIRHDATSEPTLTATSELIEPNDFSQPELAWINKSAWVNNSVW